MYTISKVAELTGMSVHTLRYYEKIGLVSSPNRNSGIRQYSESDISFLQFLNSLKRTGMTLEEILEFTMGGCVIKEIEERDKIVEPKLKKRIEILQKHLENMRIQRSQLDNIIRLTEDKLEIYHDFLHQLRREDEK